MKRVQTFYFALVCLCLSAAAQSAQRYIVRIDSPSTFQNIQSAHQSLMKMSHASQRDIFGHQLQSIKGPQKNIRIVNTLSELNMLIVEVDTEHELAQLQQSYGNKIEKEIIIRVPRTGLGARDPSRSSDGLGHTTGRQEIPWGLKAIKAPESWIKLGTRSQPVRASRVAIMDTGVDLSHSELKNNVERGQVFLSAKAPAVGPPIKINHDLGVLSDLGHQLFSNSNSTPTYDYYDDNGHGSHVAGVIAAENNSFGVIGVNPKARLFIAKVCSKDGCPTSAVIMGINWAIQEGVDVLNLSLGSPTPSIAQQEALMRAENAGIVSVAAAGNDGVDTLSYPAAFNHVISVGAVDSSLKRADFSQYGHQLSLMAPGVDVKSTVPVGAGRVSEVTVHFNGQLHHIRSVLLKGSAEIYSRMLGRLVHAGFGRKSDFETLDAKGKIALISRGEITYPEKVKQAIAAGAAGVLIYNNQAGFARGTATLNGSTLPIPVFSIDHKTAQALRHDSLKYPDFYVGLRTLKTSYEELNGTSMATPHVTGVVSLMKAVSPHLLPSQIRHILQTTASKMGSPDETFRNEYGAGLINAEAALRAVMGF